MLGPAREVSSLPLRQAGTTGVTWLSSWMRQALTSTTSLSNIAATFHTDLGKSTQSKWGCTCMPVYVQNLYLSRGSGTKP